MSFTVKHAPLHGDGGRPLERVRRFDHEWELGEYEWDPQTGIGSFIYERKLTEAEGAPGCTESRTIEHVQPNGRQHEGWRMWNGRFTFAGQFPTRW